MRSFNFEFLFCAIAFTVTFAQCVYVEAAPPTIESVLITLIDQADVPAREAGVLSNIVVREGQSVEEGQLLAQIADGEVQLEKKRADLEHDIAREEAENEVKIRFTKKSLEVVKAEHRRALESVERYKKSISQSELDRLRLVVERTTLEIEQARHDLKIAELSRRLKNHEIEATELNIERRRIVAPISGVVVEIRHRRGEWVEPGEKVVRIVRIDRLRAEGFIHVSEITDKLTGSPVMLIVDFVGKTKAGAKFPGKIVFVSPEIDPVNNQVRIWAEIDNRDLLLRPGLQGTMTIGSTSKTALDVSPTRSRGTSGVRSAKRRNF